MIGFLRGNPPPPVVGFEEATLADRFLSKQEKTALIAAYRIFTDPRREAAVAWKNRRKSVSALVALPFSVPLPSFLLWIVMVGAAALVFALLALFGKAAVEWTGDNDVGPRCRRLWAAAVARFGGSR